MGVVGQLDSWTVGQLEKVPGGIVGVPVNVILSAAKDLALTHGLRYFISFSMTNDGAALAVWISNQPSPFQLSNFLLSN